MCYLRLTWRVFRLTRNNSLLNYSNMLLRNALRVSFCVEWLICSALSRVGKRRGFLTPPDLMGLEINYVIIVASLLARKRFEP